ncbi:TetR/AcrR family transcriptional regulator [Pontibacter sp. G13]|uniref:TetR/AcrR family transcriptional regulator n=1 Tax=Pontibacter sp. G13 TaxID=3074898 RepID=UPI00288A3DB6|nr:TetR/AcrR family transcriptional regulator [Pontibacter sp. G13]WNJ19178.1 TetR/AcrR family transcriptional regulator [Pontibacter sp. G13]
MSNIPPYQQPESSESIPVKQRILEYAASLFMRFGVRRVTMDDIAKDLGISKKTIYQYFKNKAAILTEASMAHFAEQRTQCSLITDASSNSIEELVKIFRWSLKTITRIPVGVIYDLRKYHPEVWGLLNDFKFHFVNGALIKALTKGQEDGLIRAELNPQILAKLRIGQIDTSLDAHLFPDDVYDQIEVQTHMFEVFIRGIVTEKGLTLFEEYMQEQDA